MNFDQAQEIISLLKERNDLERKRNMRLSAIYDNLDGIRQELVRIRGNL